MPTYQASGSIRLPTRVFIYAACISCLVDDETRAVRNDSRQKQTWAGQITSSKYVCVRTYLATWTRYMVTVNPKENEEIPGVAASPPRTRETRDKLQLAGLASITLAALSFRAVSLAASPQHGILAEEDSDIGNSGFECYDDLLQI